MHAALVKMQQDKGLIQLNGHQHLMCGRSQFGLQEPYGREDEARDPIRQEASGFRLLYQRH